MSYQRQDSQPDYIISRHLPKIQDLQSREPQCKNPTTIYTKNSGYMNGIWMIYAWGHTNRAVRILPCTFSASNCWLVFVLLAGKLLERLFVKLACAPISGKSTINSWLHCCGQILQGLVDVKKILENLGHGGQGNSRTADQQVLHQALSVTLCNGLFLGLCFLQAPSKPHILNPLWFQHLLQCC